MNKSFLKWAGGKSQSLKEISTAVGQVKGKFIEPFVGSGVVSLNIDASEYILADFNKDLMSVFNVLRSTDDFIDKLRPYFSEHNNSQEIFYELRKRFNETSSSEERAMLFIYLNRHCFNGLCRYNKSGNFNVPFGKFEQVYFPEKELTEFKKKLIKCKLYNQSFEDTFKLANKDDVVYCDPPYVPLSDTASFTDYSIDGFSEDQQRQLVELAEKAPCKVLISNHDTEFTRKLYKNADNIISNKVNRFISASGDSRKSVYELLAVYIPAKKLISNTQDAMKVKLIVGSHHINLYRYLDDKVGQLTYFDTLNVAFENRLEINSESEFVLRLKDYSPIEIKCEYKQIVVKELNKDTKMFLSVNEFEEWFDKLMEELKEKEKQHEI